MSKYNRRQFLKAGIGVTAALSAVKASSSLISVNATGPLVLDASPAPAPPLKGFLRMGASRRR